jgi:type II secretory ATPase GspE/PulE/Tfp pilus assembly ATPase PilB-like protein
VTRPLEEASQSDPSIAVGPAVAVSIGRASREQVVLARGNEELAYHLVSIRRDALELSGPVFLPRKCHLELRVDLGETSLTCVGSVRKVAMTATEPTYSLSVHLEPGDTRVLEQLAALVDEQRARPQRSAPPIASSTLPGWASRLLAEERISERQLEEIAAGAQQASVTLAQALVEAGVIDEETIALFTNMELGVPFVDPRAYDVRLSNSASIPEALARRHRLFPLFRLDGVVTLGMADPTDLALVDQVRLRENCHVDPCLCPTSALDALIDRAYDASDTQRPSATEAGSERLVAEDQARAPANNRVVRLVQSLIEEATRTGASDIHVEPERDLLRVRCRVDGILREQAVYPQSLLAPVVSRLKVLAKLDIAETRRPQDGHFGMKVDQKSLDVRVSTIPTVHGENVVLRLLVSDGQAIELDELGMAPASLSRLKHFLDNPHGMILATGPTGSGKTTTLYAALARLNTIERNVVTVEDPVEKRLPLLRQTQINPKAGLTFAAGLRSILRQDPDVLMVGEIRDRETAEIAVQAALTGHLLLSTLHTNSAGAAIVRLSEMGIPPFLITSSLRAVIGQRLARRICSACKREVEPDASLVTGFGIADPAAVRFLAGAGCARCLHTGFKGRVGLYELLEITPGLGQALVGGASREAIEQEAAHSVDGSLCDDGLRKVREGLTTLGEVARVVGLPHGPPPGNRG